MADRHRLRHYGGFVAAGSLAFATDVGLFQLLNRSLGIELHIARLISISIAMAVSWLINRTVTFAASGPPRLTEFMRFAAVAWIASAINYAVFSLVLALWPAAWPIFAIAIATGVAMLASYFGMSRGVFKRP